MATAAPKKMLLVGITRPVMFQSRLSYLNFSKKFDHRNIVRWDQNNRFIAKLKIDDINVQKKATLYKSIS